MSTKKRDALRGKVFWITGASSGIGEALARKVAEAGAKVIISARRASELEAVRSRCPRPDDVFVLPLDVAETDRADEFVKKAIAAFGQVDVMVHNAGIGQRSLVVEAPLAEDRRVMEVNYFGVVALTKALLPSMIFRKSGHFVVVSSVVGYVGTPYRSAYAASKHALHGFFESLRAEVFKDDIAVTIVCPGFVATDIAVKAVARAGGGDAEQAEQRTKANAHGISPEACAAVIVRGIEKKTREVYVGGKEIAGIYLRRYVPGVLAKALRHVKTV